MRLSRERLLRLLSAGATWMAVGILFFFVTPSSWVIIALFCVLFAAAVGLLIWVVAPSRFAFYAFLGTGYVLFLLWEHIVRIDLLLYGVAIIVLTELFIGRRLPMLQ